MTTPHSARKLIYQLSCSVMLFLLESSSPCNVVAVLD